MYPLVGPTVALPAFRQMATNNTLDLPAAVGRSIPAIIATVLYSFASLLFIIFVIRSAYSISLYGRISKEMQKNGWSISSGDSVIQAHEETTYEASYLFFKIGAARFHLVEQTLYNGIPAYKIVARIDSYTGVPFVNFHGFYETYADAKTLMCLYTFNRRLEKRHTLVTRYDFDLIKKEILWSQRVGGELVRSDVVPLDTAYTDGLGFYYLVREACQKAGGVRKDLRIPIVSDTIISTVDLVLNETREPCKVEAYDYAIDSYKMSGHINFTGTFGVRGNFTGWISTDSSSVPLKGNLQVILGSIVVQLKDIKRKGWIPPRSEASSPSSP